MTRLAAAGLALAWTLAAGSAGAAQRPPLTRAEALATEGVLVAVEHGDCRLAAERLNGGLAERYPGFYVLAGTMYEQGLCLKANWERAVQLYQRAVQAGVTGGAWRLVAGYAEHGRDPAAALWWAQSQGGLGLPEACRAPDFALRTAEVFVAELKTWSAERLAACVYTAGVVAAVAAEAEYPPAAAEHGLAGSVEMQFVPATGSFAWRTQELQEKQMQGIVSGEAVADRGSRKVRQSLENSLQGTADRALRRFERPAMIDPAWRVTDVFRFDLRYE